MLNSFNDLLKGIELYFKDVFSLSGMKPTLSGHSGQRSTSKIRTVSGERFITNGMNWDEDIFII